MRLGGDKAPPAETVDGDDDDVTPGEDLYNVLSAVLAEADDAQKLRLVTLFSDKTPWSGVPDDLQDLFEDAGEAFFNEDESEESDG